MELYKLSCVVKLTIGVNIMLLRAWETAARSVICRYRYTKPCIGVYQAVNNLSIFKRQKDGVSHLLQLLDSTVRGAAVQGTLEKSLM